MKKLYTLLLAAAAVSGASAEPAYVLNTIESNDHVETLSYFWNENGLIHIITDMSDSDAETSNTFRIFTYNEQNQIICDEVYQNVFGLDTRDWHQYLRVNYADYTYNVLGQLETRTNYNWDGSMDGKLIMGAVIEYQYNQDGNLSKICTYYDKDRTRLFGEDTYTYEDGVLKSIDLGIVPYGGTLPVVDMRQKYVYNDDNQLIKIEDYKIDSLDGAEEFEKSVVYNYDAEGKNLTDVTKFKGRLESAKFVMHYNDMEASDIYWPVTNEQENFEWSYLFTNITNAIDSQEVWLFDNKTDSLTHAFTWLFDYEDADKALSVEGVQALPAMNLCVASCDGDRLVLGGVDRMADVTIYDAAGRCVLSAGYEMGSINVAALPAGAYVVRAAGQAVKFVK